MVVQPLAALQSPDRTPEEEKDEEEMRPPAAGGAGGGARCYKYGGAVAFCFPLQHNRRKNTKTRHATHPPAVPMVGRVAEGGGGWGAAEGPWTGRTKVQTPDDDEWQSMVHTTGPSMSLMQKC